MAFNLSTALQLLKDPALHGAASLLPAPGAFHGELEEIAREGGHRGSPQSDSSGCRHTEVAAGAGIQMHSSDREAFREPRQS